MITTNATEEEEESKQARQKILLTGEDRDGGPRLPVPDPQRLVVARAQDPGAGPVELDGADVVEVAEEREQAAAELVRPDFDAVVVASGCEERLRGVKVDAADGAIVLVKAVDERAHAVIPELLVRWGWLCWFGDGGGGGVSEKIKFFWGGNDTTSRRVCHGFY